MAEDDAEVSTDPLYVLKHSTAHVLAAAATELFPTAKYAGGTPVENAFYYDLDVPRPPSQDYLAPIEKQMTVLSAREVPFAEELLPHSAAVRRFSELDQPYK